MKRVCSQVLTCATVAHVGGWGMGTVQGAYSACNGSQVISARTPRLHRSATSRWVNTSVPVFVRTVGNQMAGAAVFIRISTLSLWVFARLQYVPQFFPHHWPCKLRCKGTGACLPCAGVIGQDLQRGLGQRWVVVGCNQMSRLSLRHGIHNTASGKCHSGQSVGGSFNRNHAKTFQIAALGFQEFSVYQKTAALSLVKGMAGEAIPSLFLVLHIFFLE